MRTLLILLACAIGGALVCAGLLRIVRMALRRRRCTASVRGFVAGVAQRRSLLSWPVSTFYFPIFQFTPEGGQTQILASLYYAQTERMCREGDSYLICYDPRRPARFYAKGWDEGAMSLGLGQLVFGLLILAITAVTQLPG